MGGSAGREGGRERWGKGVCVCVCGRQPFDHGRGEEEERGGNNSSTEMCTFELNSFLGSLCAAA